MEDIEGSQVAMDAGAQREVQDTLVTPQLQHHRGNRNNWNQ